MSLVTGMLICGEKNLEFINRQSRLAPVDHSVTISAQDSHVSYVRLNGYRPLFRRSLR